MMYCKDSEQPTGIGLAYIKADVPAKGEIYFSGEDSRFFSKEFRWRFGGRWTNSGGYGWYILGPLNMVQWSKDNEM